MLAKLLMLLLVILKYVCDLIRSIVRCGVALSFHL